MKPELTTSQKVSLIQKVNAGQKVSEVCHQAQISRKTFYKWKKRFDQASEFEKFKALQPQKPTQIHSPKRIQFEIEKLILKIVSQHPEFSSHKIAEIVSDLGIGHHGVQNVLERYSLNTYEKRLAYQKSKLEKPETKREKWLSAQERLMVIEQVLRENRPVAKVCENFGISRKTFYKWLKRFRDETQEKLERLKDRSWQLSQHPRKLAGDLEMEVLKVVKVNPAYSVHQVYQNLPQYQGRPVVGHHGVQNVLVRYGLNTMDRRYAWAGIPQTIPVPTIPIPEFAPPLEKLWWQISPFKTIPKLSLVTIFFFFLFSALTFAFIQWLRLLSQAGLSAAPGLVFATTALFFGFVFFIVFD